MTMPPWKVIFMGTPDFAVPSLESLIDHHQTEIAAVVTQPDKPKGRGLTMTPPPVKTAAEKAGIQVLQPEKIRTEEFLRTVRDLRPDLLIVVAYGKILPKALLDIPPLGALNVHASLLPKYRGAAPIQWALIKGEKKTGVTIMQLDEGMDTGPVFIMEEICIEPEDTAGTLHQKLANLGAQALIKTLNGMRAGTLEPKPQPREGVSIAPVLSKKDGLIDWNRSADDLFNLIRGLDPWPGSYTFWRGKLCYFFKPRTAHGEPGHKPGEIVQADDSGILVATGGGYLLLGEIKIEGRRRMPLAEFIRGHKIQAGEILGGCPITDDRLRKMRRWEDERM